MGYTPHTHKKEKGLLVFEFPQKIQGSCFKSILIRERAGKRKREGLGSFTNLLIFRLLFYILFFILD